MSEENEIKVMDGKTEDEDIFEDAEEATRETEETEEETDAKSFFNIGRRSGSTSMGTLDVHPDSLNYNMKHSNRGVCVILNHEKFDDEKACPERKGSTADANALHGCFRDLGFNVETWKDLTSCQVMDKLAIISKQDHTDYDSFVCCILTHGDRDFLWAKDNKYMIESVISYFTGEACKSLAGKPKIFIIQACRGVEYDNGVLLKCRDVTDGNKVLKIPNYADMLIAYSTMSGFYSWRHPSLGSWFVNHLTDVLNKYAQYYDLLSMLTIVNQRIAIYKESNCDQPEMNGKKQVPCVTHTLTRKILFNYRNNEL